MLIYKVNQRENWVLEELEVPFEGDMNFTIEFQGETRLDANGLTNLGKF